MIGYVTVGTNDFEKSVAFYDRLFDMLDTPRFMEEENFVVWGKQDDSTGFSVTRPFNQQPATSGNGTMIAFAAPSRALVDQVHAEALKLGGADEGAVGTRDEMPGFYVGYFRDLDGNKLSVFHISKEDMGKALDSE